MFYLKTQKLILHLEDGDKVTSQHNSEDMLSHHFDKLYKITVIRGVQNATFSKIFCISKTKRPMKILLTVSWVTQKSGTCCKNPNGLSLIVLVI